MRDDDSEVSREDVTPTAIASLEWQAARQAATALRDGEPTLALADLTDGFAVLRADVNVLGDGVVSPGKVLPETALRLSAVLAVSLLAENLDERSAEDTVTSIPPRSCSAARIACGPKAVPAEPTSLFG